MKRLISLLLALMLVMTGTLALAEATTDAAPAGTPEAAPFAFTMTDETEIDREAAKQLLTASGVDESQIGLIDSVIALVNASAHKLVIADNGAQYDLSLGGKEALTVAGELTEEGLNIVSTLFPNYVLTVKAETVINMLQQFSSAVEASNAATQLPAEAAEAVQEYGQEFLNKITPAITAGQPEMQEFTLGEHTFTGKLPMSVDTRIIAEAAKELVEKLAADERIKTAVESMQASGVKISMDDFKVPENLAETVPTVNFDYYFAMDDQGNQTSDFFVDGELIKQGEDAAFMTFTILNTPGNVEISARVPETQFQCDLGITYNEAGCNALINVYMQEQFLGGANINVTLGEEIVIVSDLYINDEENPLAHETTTITMAGERTMAVTAEDKTALAVEDLISGKDESAMTGISMDILLNGLGTLLTNATEAVPELNDLMSTFMGGSSAS